MKSAVVVFGEMLLPNGALSLNYKNRLDTGFEIFHKNGSEVLLLSGGPTRKNFPAEAVVGAAYLKGKTDRTFMLDTHARSTVDGIREVKKMLHGRSWERIFMVSSNYHLPRLKYICTRLWPEVAACTTFVGVSDDSNLFCALRERVYLVFAMVGPRGGLFSALIKKIFRNA